MNRTLILPLALLLSSCGDDDRQAGGVTTDEAKALDEAAEMVAEQRPPLDSATAQPSESPTAQPSG